MCPSLDALKRRVERPLGQLTMPGSDQWPIALDVPVPNNLGTALWPASESLQ